MAWQSRSFLRGALACVVLAATWLGGASASVAAWQTEEQEDFSQSRYGNWTPPVGALVRGTMYVEDRPQADGSKGHVLTTRGIMNGERFLLPIWIAAGNGTEWAYDVDFQRVAAINDSAMMWNVEVNPSNGAQRFYQASIRYGAKAGMATLCRIQLIEEHPESGYGFTVTTLAEADGPTLTPEGWHHLQVRIEGALGDEHVFSIDGAEVLRVRDSTLRGGQIGARVGLDMTRWDNVVVSSNSAD